MRRLDPFLMLDFFNVKLPGGFPDHPHRGFETVTYMLEGNMLHEDFKGNKVRFIGRYFNYLNELIDLRRETLDLETFSG